MGDRLTFLDEVTGQRFVFINDFMGHVEIDGEFISRHSLFPDIEINWDCGYITKADGTIVCALEANSYIAQFDGCKSIHLY